jgi:sugar lactone lactonase YvrE
MRSSPWRPGLQLWTGRRRLRTRRLPAVAVVGFAAFAVVAASAGSGSRPIAIFAGTGVQGFSGDGGRALSARFHGPNGVAVDAFGDVYVADEYNYRVRKITASGRITTLAGNGKFPDSPTADDQRGLATSLPLALPAGLAVDKQGNVYISDYYNRVRKVSREGMITTIAGAGTGGFGFSGDGGPATAARMHSPEGLAVDTRGNLYIADTGNNRVRKVSPAGTITTVAGTGVAGFSGDRGPATSAKLDEPYWVAVNSRGELYFSDLHNLRVRKVSANGTITTLAGTGKVGKVGSAGSPGTPGSGDGGPATTAPLTPFGLAVDRSGTVYIAEPDAIRSVSPAGTITTYAGNSLRPLVVGGKPSGFAEIAIDSHGNLYMADPFGNHVFKVSAGATSAKSAESAIVFSPLAYGITCHMTDDGSSAGSWVYCWIGGNPHPSRHVKLDVDGQFSATATTAIPLGLGGRATPYGAQVTVGRFRCQSLRSGIKCTVTSTGKGFRFNINGSSPVA